MTNRRSHHWLTLLPLLLLLLLILTGCAVVSAGGAEKQSAGESTALEALFFDAGKADAILLTTEHAAILVDCGEKGFGQTVLAELEARGIGQLDCLIVTHFDKDHVGGAAKIINSIPVKTVLQSNCPKDSEEYEKYCRALEKAGIAPVTVRETMELSFDGLRLSVDPPRKSDYDSDDSNNSSLIVTVHNGEQVLLLTGDAETERLAEYLEYSRQDCDVLKVPHHGGKESMTAALLQEAKPEYAVITCSDAEPEDAETLRLLEASSAKVFLTRLGPVRLVSDGKTLTLAYAERGA